MTSEAQTIAGDDPAERGSESFAYDAAGRIVASSFAGVARSYSYDAAGNRLTVTVGSVTLDTFTYDVADEIATDAKSGRTTQSLS